MNMKTRERNSTGANRGNRVGRNFSVLSVSSCSNPAVLGIVGVVTSSPPFCFYNGNTFVAVGRTMIQDVGHGSGEPTSCATELARAFGVPGVIALFAAPIGVDLSFDSIAFQGTLEF